jgi:hypothetical protein
VIINEIAWGGTAADASDKWIELFNITDQPINLTGWSLVALDGEPTIILTGAINAGGYFLLERIHDGAISDIPADLIFTATLDDGGETLQLLDAAGNQVDTANQTGDLWPAGSPGPDYYSMERVDPTLPDTPTNWASNNGVIHNGLSAQGDPLNGTPRQPNSNTLPLPGAVTTPTEASAPSAQSPAPTTSPTPAAPSPTPTESPVPSALSPTSTESPTSTAPTPTESPALVPSSRPTETDVPSDTDAAEEDQPPASSAIAAVPIDSAEQEPPEVESPAYQASPPYWLFALGLGLFLVVGGILLLRRS